MPVHTKRLTLIVRMGEIVCHQRAFRVPMIHGGWELKRWRDEDKVGMTARVVRWRENLTTGTISRGAYIVTLCYNRPMKRVNTLDIRLRGR